MRRGTVTSIYMVDQPDEVAADQPDEVPLVREKFCVSVVSKVRFSFARSAPLFATEGKSVRNHLQNDLLTGRGSRGT